jgi:hypothetical protein
MVELHSFERQFSTSVLGEQRLPLRWPHRGAQRRHLAG